MADKTEKRREYAREYMRRRRAGDPAKERLANARYRLANPDKKRFVAKRSLAKERGLVFELGLEDFQSIPESCPQCGKRFGSTPKTRGSLDRLVPELGYVPGNVEWVCMECNRKKQNMTYAEMVEFGRRGLERISKKEGKS